MGRLITLSVIIGGTLSPIVSRIKPSLTNFPSTINVYKKKYGSKHFNLAAVISYIYKEIVREETTSILMGIKNSNLPRELSLSDTIGKFSKGKKTPMTSLRDTEEQIEIRI